MNDSVECYPLPDKQFKNEQDFKVWFMNTHRYLKAWFEVENEEKEPGFPDVLAIANDDTAHFYETKIAWKGGRFKFEETQPRFFRCHPQLNIKVVVFDMETRMLYVIPAALATAAVLAKNSLTLNIRKF